MAVNLFKAPLTTLGYSQQTQRVDLTRGVNLHALELRLSATVDIAAGGGNDGAVVTEGIQRFLSRLRVSHDGDNIVAPLNGRDLYQLTSRLRASVTAAVNLAGPGIATTPVSVNLIVPFARQYLARPVEVCIPKTLRVNQELALYIDFEAAVANAGDSPGSAAFIVGGDRVVTITDVALEVLQISSTGNIRPWYLPRITVRESAQSAAANNDLPLELQGALRFDSILFRYLENTTQVAADRINRLRFIAGGGAVQFWGGSIGVDFRQLQEEDRALFPAAPTAVQTGTVFAYFADGGMLGNAVDPRPLTNPRFGFDVAAPGAGVGFIRAVLMELRAVPGVTRVQGAG